jgi:protein-disulfide isomerase/uncharacterized membrane protein
MSNFKYPLFYIGACLLLVAVGASFVLSGTKLGLFDTIPGCGVGSGCDNVTNGPWGSIPGINLPVSFVGFAWFLGLLSVFHCCVANGCTTRTFRWSVRVGVVASIGFIVVMISIGSFCKWCALAHVCNILFWVICEFWITKDGENSNAPKKSMGWGVWLANKDIGWCLWCRFVFILVLLWGGGMVQGARELELNKIRAEENIKEVVSGTADESTLKFLGGGHRIGSIEAPIQIVMFTDYQCPDCKRIESGLAEIMSRRNDVSVVVKHFPLNYECNDTIGNFKLHGNACWAARAAEAAAIVGGEEAWETMHTWLFSQDGEFTEESFTASLVGLGFNAQDVISTMMGDETLAIVKENTLDGDVLGVYFTPMVFINGVEYLWYYGGQGSVESVINTVANNIQEGVDDGPFTPPTANKKLVEDWRRGRRLVLPATKNVSWLGGGDIEFVVWGDYQADLSKELDKEIKKTIEKFPNTIKYTFRHFPVDESCNAGIKTMRTKYDGSCALAKLVVAVHALGGDGARWEMHNWLMRQPKVTNIENATNYALSLTGVDASVLQDVIGGIDVNNKMRVDIIAKNNVWRKSVPVLTIDNRFVPRWKSGDVPAQEMFRQIIQSVGEESKE